MRIALVLVLIICSAFAPKTESYLHHLQRPALPYNLVTGIPRLSASFRASKALSMAGLDDQSVLDNELFLLLATKGTKVFETAVSRTMTLEALEQWEEQIKSVTSELVQLTDNDILLQVYGAILKKVTLKEINALEMASFDILSSSIVDTLLRNVGVVPLTELIDDITQVHLDYIDTFRDLIDDGGDEGYSQSAKQEMLTYQFAGLARRMYDSVARGLGAEYDQSSNTMELRTNNWVGPVYARLQRRFVRFAPYKVKEKTEGMNAHAVDVLLDRVPVTLVPYPHPKYVLAVGEKAPDETAQASVNDDSYPSWSLAALMIKVIRMTIGSQDLLSLEPKVARAFLNAISDKMRKLGKPLEKTLYSMEESNEVVMTEQECSRVTAALNLGHSVVGGVLTLWNIQCNIVGIPDPTDAGGVRRVREFIQPMHIWSAEGLSKIIPSAAVPNDMPDLRRYKDLDIMKALPLASQKAVDFTVSELEDMHSPSHDLLVASLVGHAVRESSMEHFRSLLTYNSNPENWPMSRDVAFMTVFAAVITDFILSGTLSAEAADDKVGDGPAARTLYENFIALCALEEAMAVREPRKACAEALEFGLRNALGLLRRRNLMVPSELITTRLAARVALVEKTCHMMMRLPEHGGKVARRKALNEFVSGMVENATARGDDMEDAGTAGEWATSVLGLVKGTGLRRVASVTQERFARAVSSILMSSDGVTVGDGAVRKQLSEVYRADIKALARDLGMSDDVAEGRMLMVAGTIMSQILDMALEQDARQGVPGVVALLRRGKDIIGHPLLDESQSTSNKSVLEQSAIVCVSHLGRKKLMSVLNMIDNAKRSVREGDGGSVQTAWTSGLSDAEQNVLGVGTNEDFFEFCEELQKSLMTAYAAEAKV